jgi:hypothetical protein
MAQKLDALTSEIGLVVTSILSTDLALLRGYSQAKARAIASFTLLLAEGYASGSISSEQIAEETVELERMVVASCATSRRWRSPRSSGCCAALAIC